MLQKDILQIISENKKEQNKTLNLKKCGITDLPVELAKLVHLEELVLSNNQITDVSALKYLKNLKRIDLSYNKIKDISALQYLEELVEIDLNSNNIQDIDADFLKQHPKLEFLAIYENEVLAKKLMLPYWWDYFLSENCLDDFRWTLESKWYKMKYGE